MMVMKQKIIVEKNAYIRWVSRISWGLLAVWAGWFLWQFPQLPEEMPLHFGFDGRPDRWGPKEELWVPVILCIVLFAALTVVMRFPQIWNTGSKKVTEQNCRWVYQNLASMLVSIRLGMVIVFSISLCMAVKTGRNGLWFWVIWALVLFGPVIYFTVRLYRDPHKREEDFREHCGENKKDGNRENKWI